ncbi:MAG: hypothetical protein H0W64_07450 [Gammaproteobacteria bacterium]|nr:hypothetical protein [Gammaproteobacteria bacterium]
MKNRYNLALIPLSKSFAVTSLAQQMSSLAHEYLPGERSLPHVTLYHFEAEENNIATIWKQIIDQCDSTSIVLKFNKISYKCDDTICWIALLPEQGEALRKMHDLIANVLSMPIKKYYDPHMTLLNTTDKDYVNKSNALITPYLPILDTFILSLGSSDEIGQFMEVIYC